MNTSTGHVSPSIAIWNKLRERLRLAQKLADDKTAENRKRLRAQRLEIPRIHGALQRLEAGTYGDCTICDERIDAARLEKMPEVPTCMDCEELEPKF